MTLEMYSLILGGFCSIMFALFIYHEIIEDFVADYRRARYLRSLVASGYVVTECKCWRDASAVAQGASHVEFVERSYPYSITVYRAN